MDFRKIFDASYLFDAYPGSSFAYMPIFIAFFLLLILGSFYLETWMRKHPLHEGLKMTFPGLTHHVRWLGLIGFVLLFIRYENIPYFSMRFLFLLYLISIVAYTGYAVYRFKNELPETMEKLQKNSGHKSYLPKSKRKKK